MTSCYRHLDSEDDREIENMSYAGRFDSLS